MLLFPFFCSRVQLSPGFYPRLTVFKAALKPTRFPFVFETLFIEALAHGSKKDTVILLAMCGVSAGTGSVTEDLKELCSNFVFESAAEGFLMNKKTFLSVICKAQDILDDYNRAEKLLGGGDTCARMFMDALFLFPSALFRFSEVKDAPGNLVWSLSWLHAFSDSNLGSAAWTSAAMASSSDEVLIHSMSTILTTHNGELPAEVLRRHRVADAMASQMQEFLVSGRTELGNAHPEWAGIELYHVAALWDMHHISLDVAAVGCEQLLELFKNYCCPQWSKFSVARLFSHCMQKFWERRKHSEADRHAALKCIFLVGAGRCGDHGFFETFQKSWPAWPSLLDEELPEWPIPGMIRHEHWSTLPIRAFGYRLLEIFFVKTQRRNIAFFRRTGYVKRLLQLNLEAIPDIKHPCVADDLMRVEDEDEESMQSWFTDLESAEAPVTTLAVRVLNVYARRNQHWLIERVNKPCYVIALIRKARGVYAALAPYLLTYYGVLLQDFLALNPDTLNADAHEAAMEAFLANRRLCQSTDVLGVVDALHFTEGLEAGAVGTHLSYCPLAVAYTAFNGSLRCAWLTTCVAVGNESDSNKRKRDV